MQRMYEVECRSRGRRHKRFLWHDKRYGGPTRAWDKWETYTPSRLPPSLEHYVYKRGMAAWRPMSR